MIVVGFVVAAAAGALVRWEASRRIPPPIGTLVVNLAGSFGLGLLHGTGTPTATVVGVAGIGALTTFSTVAVELVEMWRGGAPNQALSYATVTVAGGVGAAWLGIALS